MLKLLCNAPHGLIGYDGKKEDCKLLVSKDCSQIAKGCLALQQIVNVDKIRLGHPEVFFNALWVLFHTQCT